ncbi:MAG: chromate transporter [Halanaerobium sp.]|nr:chromate transporter [Halanaerobium sp.]
MKNYHACLNEKLHEQDGRLARGMKRGPVFLWTIFITFFKIGLFTFGGGFAMIPLMERDLVARHGWIGKDEFLDVISITQSVPGAVAVNLSIFFGYNLAGVVGALVAVTAVALPSFVIILLIAIGFSRFSDYQIVKNIFKGIRPAVVGLIIYAGLDLAKNITWSRIQLLVLLMVLLACLYFNLNPIILILLAILVGLSSGKKGFMKKRKEQQEQMSDL